MNIDVIVFLTSALMLVLTTIVVLRWTEGVPLTQFCAIMIGSWVGSTFVATMIRSGSALFKQFGG